MSPRGVHGGPFSRMSRVRHLPVAYFSERSPTIMSLQKHQRAAHARRSAIDISARALRGLLWAFLCLSPVRVAAAPAPRVGDVHYRDQRPAGVWAGKPESPFLLRRFVLTNAVGAKPRGSGGRLHLSGVQKTYDDVVARMKASGVELVHVTPDHPAFAISRPVPEISGTVGVRFNPAPHRALGQLYRSLGLLDSHAELSDTAVHVAEPMLSCTTPLMLGARGRISTAYHTRLDVFGRKHRVGRRIADSVDALSRYLGRVGMQAPDFEQVMAGWLRRVHRHAGTVMTRSPQMVEVLQRWGFPLNPEQRLHVWPGFTDVLSPTQVRAAKHDTPFFEALALDTGNPLQSPPSTRERFARGEIPRPIVLFWGRLAAEKGVDLVVRLQKHLDGTIFVVGEGPRGYQQELARINQASGGRAIFLGPRVDPLKSELIRNSDVAVLPSRGGETFGQTRIEALSRGLAVVGLEDATFRWATGPGGVVAPDDSPEALAKATANALALDPMPGRDYVAAHFSADQVWQQFLGGLLAFRPKPR
jgi:glycosyltransferase involved in cell wall biosynthesis